MENKKITIFLFIGGIILTLLGGTFAYWSWSSTQAQQTAVTFTVASGFTCSADGGGDITSNDVELIPAHCNNSNYAIKRTVTVNPTITDSNTDVSLTMWLNVVSMGSGLRNSDNFKYVLTKNENDCTNAVTQGTFKNVADGGTVPLLTSKTYEETSTDTYYLYIWLDYAEESDSTMNQTFHFTLGGTCTDEVIKPNYVYTANIGNSNDKANTMVTIGNAMPNAITKFYDPNGPTQAISALETAYQTAHSGATANLPLFLRHTIGDISQWCIVSSDGSNSCDYNQSYGTENECTAFLQDAVTNNGATDNGDGTVSITGEGETYTFSCNQEILAANVVTESYVGFVVTEEMAAANAGMTSGTYYLKGGDNGASFLDNAKTIYDAFGGIGCSGDSNLPPATYDSTYNPSPSSNFACYVSGLAARATSNGVVEANAVAGSSCRVNGDGGSSCDVDAAGGEVIK